MTNENEMWVAAFGPDATGATAEDRARTSKRSFVRSMDQLAEDHPLAKGRRLTAFEALTAYGMDNLLQVASEGSTLLAANPTAAGRVLRERRERLNLSARSVAARARLELRVVEQAELSARLPIREYERIARALGLDERFISFSAHAVGGDDLAVRLRAMGDERPRMTHSAVAAIAEAAWVAMTQIRLETDLGVRPPDTGLHVSSNYGHPGYPAYRHGYFLAGDARKKLALGEGPLPCALRTICEDRLGIPLVQAELGDAIAGATVEVAGRRAVVVNLAGRNADVYIRRSTIAHELGHLLYDSTARLDALRVDDYEELERPADQVTDYVEQRANAFSVEFIAPQCQVLECYRKASADPVGAVMDRFGVSFTVARYQIWNGHERKIPLESLTTKTCHPDPRFEAIEAFTAYYHPIKGLSVMRAGRFSAIVLRAAEDRILSWDSAAELLGCSELDVRQAAGAIRELFPTVFMGPAQR